jgi:hypothetical protein
MTSLRRYDWRYSYCGEVQSSPAPHATRIASFRPSKGPHSIVSGLARTPTNLPITDRGVYLARTFRSSAVRISRLAVRAVKAS